MFLPIVLFMALITSSLATVDLRYASFKRLAWLDKRQNDIITSCNGTASIDDPSPCETVCGTGSRQCVQPDLCFRPQLGETCCEDGTSCPANSYCARKSGQVGCCPNGSTLDECGASVTVATLPGTESEPTSVSESTSGATTISSSTTISSLTELTSTTASTSSPSPTWSATTTSEWSSSRSSSTFGAGPTSPPYSASDYRPYSPSGYPTATTNSTGSPTYTPARQTTNSGRRVEVVWWKMAGLSVLTLNYFTFSNLYF